MNALRPPGPNYQTTTRLLQAVINDIHNGIIQVPSFHRAWCWRDGDVRKLIAAIAEGGPIGSATLMESQPIGCRTVAGVTLTEAQEPSQLILDGQQRLTAIYQACFGREPIHFEAVSQPQRLLYLFEMEQFADETVFVEDTLFSVVTKADGSALVADHNKYLDAGYQYEHGLYPANLLFNFRTYERGYREFWRVEANDGLRTKATQILHNFEDMIVDKFLKYRLPVQTIDARVSAGDFFRIFERLHRVAGRRKADPVAA